MTQGPNDVATVDRSQNTAVSWWDDDATDEVEGYDLVKDEALYALVGVPFMVTNVTFREGIQRKGHPYRDDYVSLELTVAPFEVLTDRWARILARRATYKLTAEGIAKPEEQLVINDGSTGIYRQIIQYLQAKNLIGLPDGETEGEKGETVLDLPRSEWLSGADQATSGINIRLKCSRGLRYSDYSNEYTGEETARTWYIA
jgi:hypothetical protein